MAFRIGSVFGQKSQLWYHLPPIDTFELMSRIYELDRSDYIRRRNDLIERFELEPYLQTPVRKLSLGERMRCEIVAALLHRPQVIFLDEPTIGLDVVVKQKIRDLIRTLNRDEGTTIFLTSHDPGDIEQLCERAIIINYGQVILDGPVSQMKRDYLTYKTVTLKLKDPVGDIGLPGIEVLHQTEHGLLKLSVDTSVIPIESVLNRFMAQSRLDDVTIEDPAMEHIISYIYERMGAPNSF